MLDILYYIFIFPVEGLLQFLIDRLFKISISYGCAIIYLSILLNLLLLKLSFYFDSKAKKFNALKKQCDSKIAEFKRVFKGAELQSYIRILYRQKGFHPIYALSGLGGLALQIPFFIAMIHLVENAQFLQNVSFLWIADLSKPDSISLLGFSIHLLPILMTLFTLINVFYSSKELGARIQGSLIALLFLVLLYSMPSALVLYWTCNMVFALIKEIVKNRLSLRGAAKTNLKESVQKCHAQSEARSDDLSQNKVALEKTNLPTRKESKLKYLLNTIFTPHSSLSGSDYKLYRNISVLAILNICFMICVFSPYAVYSSDVSQFDVSQTYQLLAALFGVFLISSLIIIYLTSFFYKTRLFVFGVYIVSILLIMGLANTFIFVGDYGAMDHFVLQKPDFNSKWRFLYAFLAVGLGVIIVWRFFKYLKSAFIITIFTLCVMSVLDVVKIIQTNEMYKPQEITTTDNSEAPYEKELFSYSKTEKNIVVIVLDMFSGSHMPSLLEQFPEFREKLDGFVLFNNAISTTNATMHSIATLIGGEHYAVYNMNARKDNLADSITEAFGIIGDTFIKNGYDVGYFMSAAAKEEKDIIRYNENMFVTLNRDIYLNYFVQHNSDIAASFLLADDNTVDDVLKKFVSFGVFRFVPEVFKSKVYNDAAWLMQISEDNQKTPFIFASSLYAFTHLHNTNAQKPTFKYLHSLITHAPYSMYYDGKNCKFQDRENGLRIKTAWHDYPHKKEMLYKGHVEKRYFYKHYDSEACAISYLSDFINWLKQEGIYNNTQIFVVSDHSGYDNIEIPYGVILNHARPDTIFLFKDFNARGEIQQDSKLMANYDITSIFCDNLLNGCPNVPKNILKNYPNNRYIITTMPIHWGLEGHKPNEWLINYYYKVQGSIYDESSWQDITESVKNGTFKIDGINH